MWIGTDGDTEGTQRALDGNHLPASHAILYVRSVPADRKHGIALDGDAFTHRRRARPRAHLPVGADLILRRLLDVALEAGPNSPHWRQLQEHARIVVEMALTGEWHNALRWTPSLVGAGGAWARLGSAARLVVGVSVACAAAARGELRFAMRMLDRIEGR